LVEGYLPTATVAFLDEVFKANSAILNALLGLLNERVFDNGRERIAAPLVSVVGASNEVPADEALLAFYDRFLLRVPVAAVSDASFPQLLALPDALPVALPALSTADRDTVSAAAQSVTLGSAALQALAELRAWLAASDIDAPSDRRWRQLARLMRIEAASDGRPQADELDLWLAPYVVAALPEQVPALAAWFIRDVVRAPAADAPWLTRAVQAFEQQLDIEIQTPADTAGAVAAVSDDAGKIATARSLGGDAGAQSDPLASMRMVSAALQERQRKHYGRLHIDTRVAQVHAVAEQAAAAVTDVTRARDALAARLSHRLWWPPSVTQSVLAGPEATLAVLRDLHARLLQCAAGFAALPVDHQLDASASTAAPAAVTV
jgi:MoxR-like ATPase